MPMRSRRCLVVERANSSLSERPGADDKALERGTGKQQASEGGSRYKAQTVQGVVSSSSSRASARASRRGTFWRDLWVRDMDS